MLILHVIDSLSPSRGGPPEAVRQLAKAYMQTGMKTEVVCLDRPEEKFLQNMDCPVHALGQSYIGRYALSPRLLRWLDDNIHRFDGVIMNGIWSFPGLAMCYVAQRHRKSYGVFVHGALDPWFNQKYPIKHLKKKIYWPIQYYVLKHASAVFFTTQKESDLAAKSFAPNRWNSVVVPYGITDPEEQHARSKEQIEAFYRAFPALRTKRYLLFLARFHEKKGCDLLIEAFVQFIGEGLQEIDLVMAGPDPDGMQKKLQKIAYEHGASERVHWVGELRGDVKWGAIRACDAYVLPSHQENFGISVVESLAVGRPVLISNQVNICNEIEEDGVGFVEEDTRDGTLKLLRKWSNVGDEEKHRMSQHARSTYLNRYAMSRTALAINALFSKIGPITQEAMPVMDVTNA